MYVCVLRSTHRNNGRIATSKESDALEYAGLVFQARSQPGA